MRFPAVAALGPLAVLLVGTVEAYSGRPTIDRIFPLGALRGTTVSVELRGTNLSNTISVEFDCDELRWVATTRQGTWRVEGKVTVDDGAALGPHLVRLRSVDGLSTTIIFNVGQFPDVIESEPNNSIRRAQPVSGDVEIHGRLEPASDIDVYTINVRAGERRVMDLRAIEHGSMLECKMEILDSHGRRVAFNDDRNDYLETPFLDHTFEADGTYHIVVDRYRGPRGHGFSSNSTYTLRLSQLPTVDYSAPLGARVGTSSEIELQGTALESIEKVYLTEVRSAEYMRMTYPYTMPIRTAEDPRTAADVARIEGRITRRGSESVAATFAIPADARAGLWRVWAEGSRGTVEGTHFEIGDAVEYAEAEAADGPRSERAYVVNGNLSAKGERDRYPIRGTAGRPLHFWTLSTQLGIPFLDPVLTLYDATGKKLAENDDTVGAYGNLIGNPDSSLFYTPKEDGPLVLTVKDRTARGGPSYRYRLKADDRLPAFQLFTTPENFTIERGGEAEIKVHMPREAGFDGEAKVWFEGLPEGVEAPSGTFRKGQTFEPNADGADMIIPEIVFKIRVPESVPAGAYPIRVLGVKAEKESSPDRRVIEANTCSQMGPLLDLWNFVRRPLPEITLTVVEPPKVTLSAVTPKITLRQGGSADLNLKEVNLPEEAEVELKGLPTGVSFEVVNRNDDIVEIRLKAAPEAERGYFRISAESEIGGRWAATGIIRLQVDKPEKLRAGGD